MSKMPTLLHVWQARLGITGCTCPSAYKSLGRLYGISMGMGWVRLTTDPKCPHHGQGTENECPKEGAVPPR